MRTQYGEKTITIYEIPIYSMSRDTFDEKWDKYYHTDENSRVRDEDTVATMRQICFPSNIWDFNQIIGYIVISLGSQDVFFDVYSTLDTRIHAVAKNKHFIQNLCINGCHFYVHEREDNTTLRSKICEYVKMVQSSHVPPKRYVDYTVFNATINHIDIKAIMEEIAHG